MKTINLNAGILNIDDKSISLNWDGNNASMYRWQIGKINIRNEKVLRFMPLVYGFRSAGIGALIFMLFILSAIAESETFTIIFLLISFIFFMLGAIIILGDVALPVLGIHAVHNLLLSATGRDVTVATIQNTNGNDIEFYVLPEEIEMVKGIEDWRMNEPENNDPKQELKLQKEDSISEIERLHDLLVKGILSEEEFEIKKRELLKL